MGKGEREGSAGKVRRRWPARGRLAAAALGAIAGAALAIAIRAPREAPPAAPAGQAPPPSPGSAPRRENVIELPDELAREPEVRAALAALREGHPAEAIAPFRAIRDRFPGHPEPLLALAKVHLSLGELAEAVEAASKAASLDPRGAVPLLLLGQALEARGDRDGAERAFLGAAGRSPGDPRAHFHLGRIAAGKMQTDVAIARYRKALEADPSYLPALSHLADELRDSGNLDEAARIVSRALEDRSDDADLRLNLAQILLKKGDWEAAAREFRRSAGKARREDRPTVHYMLARALEELGRDGEAVETLRAALALDPHLHNGWYALARLEEKRGDAAAAAEARRRFEAARAEWDTIIGLRGRIDRDPRDLEALLGLGAILLDQGKPEGALEVLRKARTLDPGNGRTRDLLERAQDPIDAGKG